MPAGQKIEIALDIERLHFFDAETEEAIDVPFSEALAPSGPVAADTLTRTPETQTQPQGG